MSIFGKLDAATIPTNPNFVEEGEYSAEITNGEFKTNRDGGRQLILEYTISDEASAFDGNKVREYFNIVSEDLTQEMLAMLPADEQKQIRRDIAKLKSRLCGYSAERKGLGVSEDDLNDPAWTPESLKGTRIVLGITNGSTGQYTNIKFVALAS